MQITKEKLQERFNQLQVAYSNAVKAESETIGQIKECQQMIALLSTPEPINAPVSSASIPSVQVEQK